MTTTTVDTLTLSHYGDVDTIIPRSVPADQQADAWTYAKPVGLWVSVDGPDDWKQWCEVEGWRDIDAQHHHRVTLHEDANVLHLASVEEMTAFHEEFSCPDKVIAEASPLLATKFRAIDWTTVASRYQGIIIAPYQWSLRLSELSWYYPWDCASGCIWDADAIQAVTTVRGPRR